MHLKRNDTASSRQAPAAGALWLQTSARGQISATDLAAMTKDQRCRNDQRRSHRQDAALLGRRKLALRARQAPASRTLYAAAAEAVQPARSQGRRRGRASHIP